MNKKLVFFFASALAVAGCAKEPQADNSAVSDASDANFSLIASSDVFTKTELKGTTIHWKSGDQISVWEKGTFAIELFYFQWDRTQSKIDQTGK